MGRLDAYRSITGEQMGVEGTMRGSPQRKTPVLARVVS